MASPLSGRRVVVLPDLFIDAIVRLPQWEEMQPRLRSVARQGGGNLPVPPVQFKLGGNAANTGVALARLGAEVELVAQTDALGLRLLEDARGMGLGTGHVRTSEAASATLALEFGGANVMLSHAGPLRRFGPKSLQAKDWRLLESAEAVMVANWAQNRSGTALLKAVVARLAKEDVFVYLDTGDPRHRGPDLDGLLAAKGVWRGLGCWALNENELRAATGAGPDDDLEAAGHRLSNRLGCRIDLHTAGWCASFDGDKLDVAAWRAARPRRLTGAGDTWNAGNLAGYLLGLPAKRRLALAHEVASRYVEGESGLPPTYRDLPKSLLAS